MNAQQQKAQDQEELREAVQIIADVIGPVIVKAVAASNPGVHMVGELLTTEPDTSHRKSLWIGVYTAAITKTSSEALAIGSADKALALFDERFPK